MSTFDHEERERVRHLENKWIREGELDSVDMSWLFDTCKTAMIYLKIEEDSRESK